MNNSRRKQLEKLLSEAQDLFGKAGDIKDELENVLSDEQEAYENMPDSLKEGERGEKAQQAIDALESAIAIMESFTCEDSEFDGHIEQAME